VHIFNEVDALEMEQCSRSATDYKCGMLSNTVMASLPHRKQRCYWMITATYWNF